MAPEPENATNLARKLIDAPRGEDASGVAHTLARYGVGALTLLHAFGARVVLLRKGQRYADASTALRELGIDVDAWPAAPAGLFVVAERTVYLRSRSPMTAAHELGHAIDAALGGGTYLSSSDATITSMFNRARAFVTPYSACSKDEWIAEILRSYIEVNDDTSYWPRVSRKRLRRLDPDAFAYIENLFKSGFPAFVQERAA